MRPSGSRGGAGRLLRVQVGDIMRKFLLFLIILVVGAGLFLQFGAGSFLTPVVEEEGTLATGTAVDVGGIQFNVVGQTISVKDLSVANPDGFTPGAAFAVDEITVTVNFARSRPDLLVIDQILVDHPKLLYEDTGEAVNFDVIQSNAARGAKSAPASDADAMKIIISRLEVTDGTLRVIGLSKVNDDIEATLPGFVLVGLGEAEGGVSADVIAQEVTMAVTGQVIQAVLAGAIFDIVTDPVGATTGAAEGVTDTIGGILGGGKKK